MPMYDYKCTECDGRFEQNNTIAERKIASCPTCKGKGQQLISPVSFDTAKMGLDPSFPTFAAKWAKRHEKKGTPLRTTGTHRPD